MQFIRRRLCVVRAGARGYQVTVLGAASELGQTVSLLLRTQPLVSRLVLHDTEEHNAGVAMDLAHIPAAAPVAGYTGMDALDAALAGAHLVLLAGGAPRRAPGARRAWFADNAALVRRTLAAVGRTTPFPWVGVVAEPVNSTVPLAAEVMRQHGEYEPRKVLGVTGVAALRAQALLAAELGVAAERVRVPVLGGLSPRTLVPLLSQASPAVSLPERAVQELTARIRDGEKAARAAGEGRAPRLATAFGVLVFVRGVLAALDGRGARVDAFLENNDFGTTFFGGRVALDARGATDMERFADLSPYECHLLERAIDQLRKDISKGKKLLEMA